MSIPRPKYLYLVMGLTFAPLILWLLSQRESVRSQIDRSVALHPSVLLKRGVVKDGEYDIDELVEALPNHKLEGAYLSSETVAHFEFAAASAFAFFALIWLVFDRGSCRILQALRIAAFTATGGLAMLVTLQLLGDYALREVHSFAWPILILRGIGAFYLSTRVEPEQVPFLLGLASFIFGVGLLEEFIKILPVLYRVTSDHSPIDWRATCWCGLASGIGFGVAEGIIYAAQDYNGVATSDVYLVRFISCVGQHAIWSGCAALLLARSSRLHNGVSGLLEWISCLGQIILPSAVMHGLYDTFIHRNMPYLAIASSLANFALFVWLVERTRRYGLPLKQKGPANIGGLGPKDWFRRGRR